MSKAALVIAGVALGAMLLYGAQLTYPRWGMILRQSEGK